MPKAHWQAHPGPQEDCLAFEELNEKLFGGGRGSGKTDAGMVWMVYPSYVNNPKYRGLVIRRHSIDLSDWVDRARWMYAPLKAQFTGNPPTISFPTGSVIRTGHLSDSDAYTKYQGHEYHRVLIEEASHIPSEGLYEKLIASCRSTVPELKPRVMLTSNPDGPGAVWLKKRFRIISGQRSFFSTENGQTRMYIPSTLKDNPSLLADAEYTRRLESITDPELKKAWLEGDWDAFSIKGSYYGDILALIEKQGHIRDLPYDPLLPVSLWFDLGINDSMALIFVQFLGSEKRIIDSYEMTGMGLDHYAEIIRSKKYMYDTIWLPHDGNVRELGTGKSRLDMLRAFLPALNIQIVRRSGAKQEVQEGISMARLILPTCYFDATKCEKLLTALRHYRHEYDEVLDVYRPKPLHDWASNYADSFRYFAVTCGSQTKGFYTPQGQAYDFNISQSEEDLIY